MIWKQVIFITQIDSKAWEERLSFEFAAPIPQITLVNAVDSESFTTRRPSRYACWIFASGKTALRYQSRKFEDFFAEYV